MEPESHRFERSKRLRTKADFQAVFSQPIKSASPYFTVLARPNDRNMARLGIIVAKRVLKRAVDRSRARRLIREAFRSEQDELAGLDVVVLVRAAFDEKKHPLRKQWKEVREQWAKRLS